MSTTRSFTRKIFLATVAAAAIAVEGAATDYIVSNTAESGTGSLRAAIEAANDNPGADVIKFSGLSVALHTIALTSPLPAITDTVTIDGATIIGAPLIPLIQIDGSGAGINDDGLVIEASNCVIRYLVFSNWGDCGIQISGSSNTIESCYIGTDLTGTADAENKYGIALRYTGQAVSGNLIGGSSGQGNLISGNSSADILLQNSQVTNTTIQGNKIGTNLTGAAALGNNYGILVQSSSNNIIGGTTASSRNLVSGNATGIFVSGTATGNLVTGNYIGTNQGGTAAIQNTAYGIEINGPGNTIGGSTAGAGNVVSGNGLYGILIETSTGNAVLNNYIGTNAAGTAAVPNNGGIRVESVTGQVIGGASANEGNLISGNAVGGISLDECTGAVVQGNRIGVDKTGGALGNVGRGITISDSTDVLVGGTGTGEGNTIAYNSGVGVMPYSGSTNVRILGNIIYNSASTLGIDINFDGAKPNDHPDADGITNKPVIGTVDNSVPDQVTVQTTLQALESTEYRIEYFSNPTAVSQGQVFLGAANITTDETGMAEESPTLSISGSLSTGAYVTSTATPTLTGGTSEFSTPAYVPVTLSAVTIE